ncbi:unnamed protein product [Pleuronectes platessa]|uniref:Uncharacterized protein n=1 Tax=Pleuronectes platessa TaxID=8262 RepID=A0A9N7V4L9_PLEPL|nr:unnamed protein product [Pleuronectes platessa]
MSAAQPGLEMAADQPGVEEAVAQPVVEEAVAQPGMVVGDFEQAVEERGFCPDACHTQQKLKSAKRVVKTVRRWTNEPRLELKA